MSGEYTDAEIKKRLAEVVDHTISIDRRTFSSADFILDSLKALVGKSLSAENDALYYVIKLFTVAQSKKCQTILTQLDTIERFAFICNQEIPLADPAKLEDILDTLEAMTEVSSLAGIVEQASRLNNYTKSLVKDSKRADGSIYTGYDPNEARTLATESLSTVKTLLAEVSLSAFRYVDAGSNYSRSELNKYPLLRLAQEAQKLFSRHLEETTQDPLSVRLFGRSRLNLLNVIRDLVLVNSVFLRRSAPLDTTAPKYDSTVTTVGKQPAVLSGGTLPFTYPLFQGEAPIGAGGSVHITVDGIYEDDITSPYAPPPVLNINSIQDRVYGTESGRFAIGDGNPLTLFHSGVAGVPFLKTYTPQEHISIYYKDTVGQFHTLTWDSGLGAIVDAEDPSNTASVTLIEATGSLTLDFSPVGAKVPGNFEPINVIYRYYIVGDYTVRDSTGVVVPGTSAYNKFSVLFQNTLLVYNPSTAQVVSTDKELWGHIGTAMGAAPGAGGLALTVTPSDPDVDLFSTTEGGSGTRVMLPNYTTDLPTLNTEPFAPTWLTGGAYVPPTDLNRALQVVFSNYPAVYGGDLGLDDLTVGAAISDKVVFRTSALSVAESVSGTAPLAPAGAAAGEVITTTTTAGYAVGDSIEITSPYTGVVKVTEVVSGTDIKVRPYVALDFDPAPAVGVLGEVLMDTAITFNVSRKTAQLQSVSSSVSSSVEATLPVKGGFGFSGSAKGTSNQVTLTGTSLNNPLRAGDPVFQGNTQIGSISSSSGTEVKLRLDGSTSFTYPFTNLRVESLGKTSYYAQRSAVRNAFLELNMLVGSNQHFNNFAVFLDSGSGMAAFLSSLVQMRAAVTALKLAYDNYEANSVREIDSLVRTLQEEKLTLLLTHLRDLNFTAVSSMTAEEVSTQSSMENLLEEVSSALGSSINYVEAIEGPSRLDDYFSRGDGLTVDEYSTE